MGELRHVVYGTSLLLLLLAVVAVVGARQCRRGGAPGRAARRVSWHRQDSEPRHCSLTRSLSLTPLPEPATALTRSDLQSY
jgi:hypothetical protein